MLKITELKTEYQTDPMGLDCKHPRFFWKLESDSAVRQTAYRILVASSEQKLKAGEADLYDSGLVQSEQTVGAEYRGKELKSRQRCYVRVIAYAGGEAAESGVGAFEMGLLAPDDWKGNWMSMPVNHQGGTALYRKKITLQNREVLRARAYICALGYHEFYVNGRKIGNSVLNPGVTEYSQRVLYCVYDMLPALTAGDNVIGIEVGHGWYGAKKVFAQFYIDYSDGTCEEYHSSTNGGWWVSGSPVTDNSVYGGETYDARLESVWPKDWATTGFEPAWDNGWMFTVWTAPASGRLEPQLMEPIEVCASYPAVSVVQKGNGVLVADIGRNIAGWARIAVRGERGSRVTLKYGERLTGDGYVNRVNLRSARATDVYILKGEGEEIYAPRFTYHGFQYVQVELEGRCELLSLTGEHVHTAVRTAGSFDCSDEALNALHKNAVVTELNNQHSILTDCPQRDERFGWLNDLGSRLYQTVYNCGMERFFPKFTRDITHTQLPSGGIGDTAPFFTGGRPADPVCIAYLLMPRFSYTYYGDSRPAQEEYPFLKKWVEYLLSCSEDYVVNYSYYADWVAPECFDEHTDNLYVSTLYLYWHLREMAAIARIVGNRPDAERYERLTEESREAINRHYFHPETCNYESGTQAANAIPLSLGIVPEEYRARVAENVYRDVVKKNYHSSCGNVGYRHLFYVLADYGYLEAALRMLKNPEYPGWGFMLANGATSVWERWESEMSNEMDSFNHPMFGSYDAFFYHYLGGIRVEEDAFACNQIVIAPIPADGLEYVDSSFDTVRGRIVSNWRRAGGCICYHIELPLSVTAEIRLGGQVYRVSGGVYDYRIPDEERAAV